MRRIILGLIVALPLLSQKAPELNDGEAHGDPPFMIEDGWRPLLHGRDLSGWHGQDAGKPSDWFTTKYVLWDR